MLNPQTKRQIQDQMVRTILLSGIPKRIISLVPSQTELLFYLGLKEEVVGITRFCIHPSEMYRTKTRIGGTKKIDFKKIKELKPDLIIGNKEENEEEQIKVLEKEYPVWMSDVKTLDESLDMIKRIGHIVNRLVEAINLVEEIEVRFKRLSNQNRTKKLKVIYFIWKKPFMVAGCNTFIHSMLQYCGFENMIKDTNKRYPEITLEELETYNPDCILLSSEPYPFKEADIKQIRYVIPTAKIMLVDGELFSWYGPRLLNAPEYFGSLMG